VRDRAGQRQYDEIPENAEVLLSSNLSGTRSIGMDEAVWLRV
jgi:hypothetical protein